MLFKKSCYKLIYGILIVILFLIFIGETNINVNASDYDSCKKNISDLSTEEIVNQIVNHELNYIYLFSDPFIGVEELKLNNKYYKELINREGYLDYIENLLQNQELSLNCEKLELLLNILENNYNYYLTKRKDYFLLEEK